MDLSEKAKAAMEVLSDAVNSVFYIYHTVSGDFEKLHEADAGEELTVSVDFLLCDPPYHVRGQSKSEDTNYDLFEPNEKGYSCDIAKMLIKPRNNGHASCSTLQCSLWWQ